MEADLNRKDVRLKEAEDKLAHVEKDYEGYKVRAQSVLKQAKDMDTKLGTRSQEVLSLERTVQSLNEKLVDQR